MWHAPPCSQRYSQRYIACCQGNGYLVLEGVLAYASGQGIAQSENWADFDASAAAEECSTVPSDSDADNPLASSIRDEAALPLMTDNAATLLDFHIIYSPVYWVPVLLIQGRHTGKAPTGTTAW